jgi:hypothetical protein
MQEPFYPTIHYASYLLRLRWTRQAGELHCHIMLKNVISQQEQYFVDLESLLAYLHRQPKTEQSGAQLPGEDGA